jgi:hypothetical protein
MRSPWNKKPPANQATFGSAPQCGAGLDKRPPGFIGPGSPFTTANDGGFSISKRTRFVLVLGILGLLLTAGTYSRGRFYIHAGEINPGDLELVLEILQQTEELFASIYNYLPAENLDLIIMPSVQEMKAVLGVGPWVGAYYANYKTYLQPLGILKKREVLRKILFIEYAHYFIDSYTGGTCPPWFNEMCSYYLFRLYADKPAVLPAPGAPFTNVPGDAPPAGRPPAQPPAAGKQRPSAGITDAPGTAAAPVAGQTAPDAADASTPPASGYTFTRYCDFTDLNRNIRERDRLEAFYNHSLRFSFFLQERYGVNPCLDLLKAMHGGVSLEKAMEQATGKTPAVLFEKDYLTWPSGK